MRSRVLGIGSRYEEAEEEEAEGQNLEIAFRFMKGLLNQSRGAQPGSSPWVSLVSSPRVALGVARGSPGG